MAVRVNSLRCNGCGEVHEPMCVKVCPGDLLFKDEIGKCSVRDIRDCWDCAACVKECSRQALEIYLPVQLGGRGSTLKARKLKDRMEWLLIKPDGREDVFEIFYKP